MAASMDYILPEAAWCSEFTNLVQFQERVQYFKAALKYTFVLVGPPFSSRVHNTEEKGVSNCHST